MWEGEHDLQIVLYGYMYIAVPKFPEAHGVRAFITWGFHHIGMLDYNSSPASYVLPFLECGARIN